MFRMLVLSFLVLFSATTLAQLLNENGACLSLHDPCQSDEYDNRPAQFNDVFNKASCTAYFTCGTTVFNETVDDLINAVSKAKFPPKAASGFWPPFSVNIFNQHSTDGGKTWSQQNYIDFYYGELANRTQVFPNNTAPVLAAWSNIAAWTGFCQTKAIPYQNLADWFKWSSTVQGAAASC